MKRRQILQYAQAGLFGTLGLGLASALQPWQAVELPAVNQPNTNTPDPNLLTNSLKITWLGHTCFYFTGDNLRLLVNPFQPLGCTAGYPAPTADPELILVSSRLLDEGVVEGFTGDPPPSLLYEPGNYKFNERQIQGFNTKKDREGGRRFGTNVAWMWQQAGIKILHMGSLASPLGIEERILIGRPDILFLPVGGGVKSYTAKEAQEAIALLKPKLVIPTHYRTSAADANSCDLSGIEEFLQLFDSSAVKMINGNSLTLTPADLPISGTQVQVFNYNFASPNPLPQTGPNPKFPAVNTPSLPSLSNPAP